VEPLLVTPKEAAHVLGIGRTKVYALMRSGELESVKLHGARRIPADGLSEYVTRLRTNAKCKASASDRPRERGARGCANATGSLTPPKPGSRTWLEAAIEQQRALARCRTGQA
jgi:excisionase family DNA binding protein